MTRTEDRLSRPTDAASSLESANVHFAIGTDLADPKGEFKSEHANSKANLNQVDSYSDGSVERCSHRCNSVYTIATNEDLVA